MKHKHHIIPKHMGGTDDPSNLIELTVEEHAEAHRILFEKYGRKEDEIAWKALSGSIGKEEIIYELAVLGSKKGREKCLKGENHPFYGKTRDEKTKQKISEKLKGHDVSEETRKLWSKQRMGRKHSEETKQKMSKKQKEIGNRPPNKKGVSLSEEHKKNISIANKGKKISEDQIKKLRMALLGRKHSEETKKRMSESLRGRKITWNLNATTPEANAKRSASLTGRPKPVIVCPHCQKSGGASQMKQWHFDNCKEKK